MSYLQAPNRREVCLKLPVSIIRRGSVPMNMIMVAYPYPLLIINIIIVFFIIVIIVIIVLLTIIIV